VSECVRDLRDGCRAHVRLAAGFSIKPFLSENDGAQLQKYTLLVDLAMVGLLCIMLLMRLFVRLMFFLSKRYSAIRHLFHVCLSFEHPLVWMLWCTSR